MKFQAYRKNASHTFFTPPAPQAKARRRRKSEAVKPSAKKGERARSFPSKPLQGASHPYLRCYRRSPKGDLERYRSILSSPKGEGGKNEWRKALLMRSRRLC